MGLGGLIRGVGNAISRPVRGIGRIARGNFREGFGDIGHGIKRGAQAAALVGSGGTIAMPLLAAGGGMLERGTEKGAGFKNVIGAGISGASGAVAARGIGDKARSIGGAIRGGQQVAGEAAAGGVQNLAKLTPGQIPGQAALSAGMTPGVPKAMEIGKYAGKAVGSGVGAPNIGSLTSANPVKAMDIGKYSTDAMGHGGGMVAPHSSFEIGQYDDMLARNPGIRAAPKDWRNVSHGMDANVNAGDNDAVFKATIKHLNGGPVPGYQPPSLPPGAFQYIGPDPTFSMPGPGAFQYSGPDPTFSMGGGAPNIGSSITSAVPNNSLISSMDALSAPALTGIQQSGQGAFSRIGGALKSAGSYAEKHPNLMKFSGDALLASQDDPMVEIDRRQQDRLDEQWAMMNDPEEQRRRMIEQMILTGAWRR